MHFHRQTLLSKSSSLDTLILRLSLLLDPTCLLRGDSKTLAVTDGGNAGKENLDETGPRLYYLEPTKPFTP